MNQTHRTRTIRIPALAAAILWSLTAVAPAMTMDQKTERALERAERHLLAYRTDAARQALQPLRKQKGDAAEVGVMFGRLLAQEQAYEDAIAELEDACSSDPHNPEPYIYLGEVYQLMERGGPAKQAYTEARDRARTLVKSDRGDARAHFMMGIAQLGLGGREPARVSLERAAELDPADPLPRYYLGTIHFVEERWQAAVDELDAALAENSGLALGYFFRGMAYGKLGRKAQMIADLDRFVAMAPNAPEAEAARAILKTAR